MQSDKLIGSGVRKGNVRILKAPAIAATFIHLFTDHRLVLLAAVQVRKEREREREGESKPLDIYNIHII